MEARGGAHHTRLLVEERPLPNAAEALALILRRVLERVPLYRVHVRHRDDRAVVRDAREQRGKPVHVHLTVRVQEYNHLQEKEPVIEWVRDQ